MERYCSTRQTENRELIWMSTTNTQIFHLKVFIYIWLDDVWIAEHQIHVIPYMKCVESSKSSLLYWVALLVCDLCDGDRHKHSMHASALPSHRTAERKIWRKEENKKNGVKHPRSDSKRNAKFHMNLIWLLMLPSVYNSTTSSSPLSYLIVRCQRIGRILN